MSKKLDGKVAVITGSNSGIGLATARRFVAEGTHVFSTRRRPGGTAVRRRGWEQPRVKLPRKCIGWYETVESLPATLPRGSERVPKMQRKASRNLLSQLAFRKSGREDGY
jgi:NAD(P)-dependent dehydrogenase (short-subunit alcohol dehydrogenase family)